MRKKKQILEQFILEPFDHRTERYNKKLFLEVLLDLRNQLGILNKSRKNDRKHG